MGAMGRFGTCGAEPSTGVYLRAKASDLRGFALLLVLVLLLVVCCVFAAVVRRARAAQPILANEDLHRRRVSTLSHIKAKIAEERSFGS